MRHNYSSLLGVALRVACMAAILGSSISFAQRVVELRGFRYAEYYDAPSETRVKVRLVGAKAQPQPNGQVIVTGVRLETFREDGAPELIIEAPECTHDASARSVTSPGPLLVKMADGSFSIHGEGFQFQQTNSTLSISNNVETVARPDLLESKEGGHEGGKGSSGPLEILSDRFRYSKDDGMGVYSGHVRVAGTNLSVSCGALTLKLPVEERRLRSIDASQDVIMDYAGMHASGQKVIYNVDTGIAEVTGKPTWSSEGREGRADKFTIDRTNRVVLAEGDAWLRMPGQTLAANLLPRLDSNGATNRSAAQSVQVQSATYELRTNMAVFDRNVVVTEMAGDEAAGQLTCAKLTALFTGTNQLDRLIAEKNVQIVRGDNALHSQRATYSAANSLLELRENPSWQAGPREGKGTEIDVDTTKNEMVVRGDATMKMPAEAFSAAVLVRAKPGASSTATNAAPPAQAQAQASESQAPQFAEISSAEYDLSPQRAVFKGGVRINHPQTTLTSEVLTVDLPEQGGRVERILADRKVDFTMVDPSGQRVKGASDQAIYSYAVTGTKTNELLQLAGNAVVINTNGVLRSPVIYYNRSENKLVSPDWNMKGTVPDAYTNKLAFPKRGSKRK